MTLKNYLADQKKHFVEFIKDPNQQVVVAGTLAALERYYRGLNIELQEFCDEKSYYIKNSQGFYELFIKANYKSYRKRYIKFLKDVIGISQPALPSSLHVDHLFSKSSIPVSSKNPKSTKKPKRLLNHYYIRMILLEGTANMDWGRNYEKSPHPTQKQLMFLSYSLVLKALEFSAVKKSGPYRRGSQINVLVDQTLIKLQKDIKYTLPPVDKYTMGEFFKSEINGLVNGKFTNQI
ncbi:hypothetical protein [Priestia aryabhattai]|uniref:Uncharacterized protein n=1 Tax=Priestia aryabhattai TaxID=412384 RepID=A0ABD5L100_PRIAR